MTTAFETETEETAVADDAPYGRKPDGSPRAKPGPKKGTRVGAAAAPPRRPGGPGRPPTRKGTDYRPGINGLLQIASFPLAIGGRLNPNLALDSAAIAMHAPNIAEALNTIAAERPEVAAALDRVLSVGPYGLLIGAVIPLVAQIAANHGKLPDGVAAGMGAIPREEFRSQLVNASDAG